MCFRAGRCVFCSKYCTPTAGLQCYCLRAAVYFKSEWSFSVRLSGVVFPLSHIPSWPHRNNFTATASVLNWNPIRKGILFAVEKFKWKQCKTAFGTRTLHNTGMQSTHTCVYVCLHTCVSFKYSLHIRLQAFAFVQSACFCRRPSFSLHACNNSRTVEHIASYR